MRQSLFPPLPLEEWRASRDTIHLYSQLVGAVRQALTPPQKHSWHAGLHAAAAGLTTTPIPSGYMTFDILLDFTTHQLTICTSEGDWWDMRLERHTASSFRDEMVGALKTLGIAVELETAGPQSNKPLSYDTTAVEDYWQALSQIDSLLKQFKGELHGETSPVLLWPNQFELSFTWFSSPSAPVAGADEQMTFGFATGDGAIAEPYFYVIADPWPESFGDTELPAGASWYGGGWQGVLLRYENLRRAERPRQAVLDFWRKTGAARAALVAG